MKRKVVPEVALVRFSYSTRLWIMSRAAFAVTKWRKYRSAQLYGTTMEEIIDDDLKHRDPPSADMLVELMLLGDDKYMKWMMNRAMPPGGTGRQRMGLSEISHDSTHPLYKRIANAFGYANSRRKKAGLSLDKWPIPIRVHVPPPNPFQQRVANPNRRLVWSLNHQEVCAARGMFRRYVHDGLIPFRVDSDGSAHEQVNVFDPASCEMLFKQPGVAI